MRFLFVLSLFFLLSSCGSSADTKDNDRTQVETKTVEVQVQVVNKDSQLKYTDCMFRLSNVFVKQDAYQFCKAYLEE